MFESRLKELRKSKGFTQKEIALLLGIKERTYKSYENNERETDSQILIKIANLFDVSIDYLLDFDCKKIAPPDILNLSEREKNLVKAYRNRPDMQRAVDTLLGIDNKPQIQMQPKFESADPLTKFQKTGRYGEKIEHLPKSIMDKVHSLDDDEPPDIG